MFSKEIVIRMNALRIEDIREYMNRKGVLVDVAIGMTVHGPRTGQVVIQVLNDQIDRELLLKILKDSVEAIESENYEKVTDSHQDPEVN